MINSQNTNLSKVKCAKDYIYEYLLQQIIQMHIGTPLKYNEERKGVFNLGKKQVPVFNKAAEKYTRKYKKHNMMRQKRHTIFSI